MPNIDTILTQIINEFENYKEQAQKKIRIEFLNLGPSHEHFEDADEQITKFQGITQKWQEEKVTLDEINQKNRSIKILQHVFQHLDSLYKSLNSESKYASYVNRCRNLAEQALLEIQNKISILGVGDEDDWQEVKCSGIKRGLKKGQVEKKSVADKIDADWQKVNFSEEEWEHVEENSAAVLRKLLLGENKTTEEKITIISDFMHEKYGCHGRQNSFRRSLKIIPKGHHEEYLRKAEERHEEKTEPTTSPSFDPYKGSKFFTPQPLPLTSGLFPTMQDKMKEITRRMWEMTRP